MHYTIIRLLIVLICCLPTFTSAATNYSIHAEWANYTPPSGFTLSGFKLYQEGVLACQTEDAGVTAIDCTVSLTADSTNFTLAATFNDGTESPQSSPFAFTIPSGTTNSTSLHAEWTSYTPPSGFTLTGFKLYQEGALACQTQDPNATGIDCSVSLTADSTNFTLTATFSDGTESPHSSPFVFFITSGTTPELKAVIATNLLSGQTPLSVTFDASSSTGTIASYQWDFGDGSTATGNTTTHIYTTADTYTATLTVTNATGQISTASSTVTATAPAVILPPTAVISSSTTTGLTPLTVTFDASSSTGTIASYQWDFGDGSTATGNTATHIYTTAGTYTTKLTVTNTNGLASVASTTVTATAPVIIPPALPPTAVISSSTAAGQAPLTVTFNGTGSTAATNASIASYSWSFGDGSSATGATTSHAFTTAGTYNTVLTVTDSKGLTSSASTPVVVTAPVVITNKAPTAAASLSTVSGTSPLAVTFDGSASTDSDGTIASYVWNFGDGSTATGKTATHTYTTAAAFTATLQVIDNQGATGSTSKTITTTAADPFAGLNIELGEIAVSSNWVRVPLTSTFTNPIVVAGPPGFNNADPCVVRLRNVNSTGFDIKLAEWNYQDGTHPEETITYLVMEKGRITLPDGSIVEAGSFAGTTSFQTVRFSKSLAKLPVVITTIASANEADTISGRIKNIGLSSFAYYFREQEKNRNTHVKETVNFIAWEPGKGTIGSVQFEAATTAKAVTNAWYSSSFKQSFTEAPLMLADMQTTSNTDTSALRVQKVTTTGFQLKVEEEQSKDSEVTHPAEMIGFLALNQTIPLRKSFSDSFSETSNITLAAHIPDNGETWNVQSGSSYTVGTTGLLHTVDNSSPYLAYNGYNPNTADYSVTVTGEIRSLSWARSLVSCARMSSEFDGYCTRLVGDSSLQLRRYDNGTATTLKSVSNLGLSANTSYKVSTIVNGSTIGYTVYQGEALITSGSITDTTYTAAGHPGLGLSSIYTKITSIETE